MRSPPTLAELTEEIRKFNALLQDPQPGLLGWHHWFHERCVRTREMLDAFIEEPDNAQRS